MASRPVLYTMPQTRSGVALWMHAELGEPCEIRIVDLRSGAHKAPDYLAVNPMGKVPALVHDGVVVTESAAIIAYLADAYPAAGLAPAPGSLERGAYYRWMFFGPSVLEPMMLDKLGGVTRENTAAAGHGREEDVMTVLRQALQGRSYLVGDRFTAADIVVGGTLNFAMMFGAVPREAPFADYVEGLMARPAAQKAAQMAQDALAALDKA